MKAILLRASALSGGLMMVAAATPAWAQDAAPAASPTPAAQPAPADPANRQSDTATADDKGGDIVVTGSRIARRDYTADSPIVSVNAKAIENSGPSTLEASLNNLPQFTAIRPGSTLTASRAGRNNANLRGLGISRTLVLLDGRRMQPSDSLGTIDLNTIPSSLIENVEVITGGASAVYGSDAIAGVVNFKLRHNFTGLAMDAQYGITDRGDSGSFEGGATLGGDFADGRGHIDLSFDYLNRQGSIRNDRPYFHASGIASNLTGALILGDAANLPSAAAIASVFGKYGSPTPARNATFSMNGDGTLFTPSAPVYNYRAQDGGIYELVNGRVGIPYGETYALQAPLTRYTFFGQANYKITDAIEAYAQVYHVAYDTEFNVFGGSVRSLSIPITNPFIPADLKTILASRPNPNAPLVYSFSSGRLARTVIDTHYNVDQYLGGFRGALGVKDWKWDVYASYGRTDQNAAMGGQIDKAALTSLINAPDGGKSVCPAGFNPFSSVIAATDPTQAACFGKVSRTVNNSTKLEQTAVEASLEGGLITLPAGEVRFAAGLGYRRNSLVDSPSPGLLDGSLINTTLTVFAPTHGEITVKEAFGELLVPLIHDTPLIKSLSLDLAYRLSSYSTSGDAHTWKASADWKMFNFLTFRGGVQQAIRAPSLGEVFSSDGGGQGLIGSTASGQGDPCDVTGIYRAASNPNAAKVRALCVANGVPVNVVDIFRFSGSSVQTVNPISAGLRPETARTYTGGAVITSPWSSPLLQHFSLSVDYYNITVKDAIGTITAPVALAQCFNSNGSNPNYSNDNVFCQQIQRDSGGNILQVQTPRLNLASYKTSGVDVQLDWSAPFDALGLGSSDNRLGLNAVVSYLAHYKIQNLAGSPFVDYAGTIGNGQIDEFTISYPRWKVQTTINLGIGPADFSFQTRWVAAMYNSLDAGSATHSRAGSDSRVYFDLTSRFQVNDKFEFRFGVLNIADKQPPVWTGEGATDLALYDVLGRRFFVGAHVKF
jgi:outer membrane receptor protein involved in Fe transport